MKILYGIVCVIIIGIISLQGYLSYKAPSKSEYALGRDTANTNTAVILEGFCNSGKITKEVDTDEDGMTYTYLICSHPNSTTSERLVFAYKK